MKRFLIATDGSQAAEAAVQAGVQLAGEQKAGVVLLHVVDATDVVAPPFGPILVNPVELGTAEDDPALAHAAEVAQDHGVSFELRLVAGFDYETIVATADEIDAELIAVGSNRHGALGTVFLGSVSKELLRRTNRPVLVVHPTSAPIAAVV
jgi:nucleotide-binding universal stress UspA family protein